MKSDFEERAAIMEFDGRMGRLEAERLARERPWDDDPTWGLPRAQQIEMDLGLQGFREKMKNLWEDY